MPKYFRAPPKAIARPRDPAFNSINVDNNDYEEDRFQVSYQKQEDQDQDQQQQQQKVNNKVNISGAAGSYVSAIV